MEKMGPSLGTTAGSQTEEPSELLVALDLCFPEKWVEQAENRSEVEELAGGGEKKSLS